MFKFQDYLFENKSYNISFDYKGDDVHFRSSTRKGIYTSIIDWLYKNGYNFKGTSLSNKILNEEEVKKIISSSKTYRIDHFHNIDNSGNFIVMNSGFDQLMNNLFNMLTEIGIDKNNIKISKGDEELKNDENNDMTFIEAAQKILKDNGNKPMTSLEIYSMIKSDKMVKTSGLTPQATLNAQMILYSENSTAKNKNKKSIFKIVEGTRPYKFILLSPDVIKDEDGEIKLFSKFRKTPFDIESELSKAQSQSQNDVETFNKFKAIQDEEEKELVKLNPFKQAICVLGESGAGKSVTIENVLSNEGDEYEFIIPTAATTGLLAQFSPSKSTYVPSRLGKMLIEASKNPNKLYTAIFDEMHKSSTIEMINDELLQAISPKRNAGRRFISLDHDTAEIFSDSNLNYERGNILIPDNFGFIFISSKPNVIASNADFFNRVDIINLTEDDRNIKTSMELLSKVISDEDKSSLSKNSLD